MGKQAQMFATQRPLLGPNSSTIEPAGMQGIRSSDERFTVGISTWGRIH